jgi:hypothetical protein
MISTESTGAAGSKAAARGRSFPFVRVRPRQVARRPGRHDVAELAVFAVHEIVNERGSAILAHCARAPGRRYRAPSASTCRFNEGSGLGPARAGGS